MNGDISAASVDSVRLNLFSRGYSSGVVPWFKGTFSSVLLGRGVSGVFEDLISRW